MRFLPACLPLLALAPFLSGCDSAEEPPDLEPTGIAVTPHAVATLTSGALPLSLTETAKLGTGFAPSEPPPTLLLSENTYLTAAGLWFVGTQEGETRVNARYHNDSFSNYAPCAGEPGGVFLLSADSAYTAEGWPASVGAPAEADGTPRVYGDEMLWTSVCSSPGSPDGLLDHPIEGVRTNIAIYRHNSNPHTTYVRYEIINEGEKTINDAYIGQWSDPDINVGHYNYSAFDVNRSASITYLPELMAAGHPYSPRERGEVIGLALLQTPENAPIAGHRQMDKYGSKPTAGVMSASHGSTTESYRYALKGLGNDGRAITDPNGQPTPFAFTGNPVTGAGWLDGFDADGDGYAEGRDLRDLTSAGPFNLMPGETEVFTVVWVGIQGLDLADGFASLYSLIDGIRATPSLWNF